jgi:hypothetical protein
MPAAKHMTSAGGGEGDGTRTKRIHLPCLLRAPEKVSKASWVSLQTKPQTCEHAGTTFVSHAGRAASVPTRRKAEGPDMQEEG